MVMDVYRYNPVRVRHALILTVLASLAEGVGLALLLPVLGAVLDGDGIAVHAARLGLSLPPALLTSGVLAIYALVIAAAAALVWRRSTLLSALRHDFIADLSKRTHRAVLSQPPDWMSAQRRADLTYLLTTDVARTGQGVQFVFMVATALLQLPALTALALAISPAMALGAGAIMAAVVMLSRPFDRRARQAGQEMGRYGSGLFARADESVAHLTLIKTHKAERRRIAQFDTATDDIHHLMHGLQAGQASARAITQGGGAIGVTVVVWAALVIGEASLESIAVLVLVMARMLPLVGTLHQGWRSALTSAPAYTRIQTLFEEQDRGEPLPPAAPAPRISGPAALRLEGVSVARRPDGPAIIRDLDLTLEPGTLTAITGPSGAGKTTLGLAVAGLLPLSGGRVWHDGALLRAPRALTLRRDSVLSPQDPALFHDTLAANLRLARPDAPEDALWDALSIAGAADFAEGLPDRLDTMVGDRGMRLSGGERQRIALAQAVLAAPRLLVLDEVTSALDAETEARVIAALLGLRRHTTMLFITHRQSVLDHADQTVFIDYGQAVQRGERVSDAP